MSAHLGFLARRLARLPPPMALASLYAALILIGALTLMLPFSRKVSITWSDAFFTSTSAVTVTGLSVLDVHADFTFFGQLALATLMQLGGTGLMVFAVMILGSLGLPVGITGQIYLREDLNQSSLGQLRTLARTILKVALVCEALGAAVLAVTFVPDLGLIRGLWAAVFHAVSAFNNAGFSNLPQGLAPYVGNAGMNLAIPALVLLGGTGYVVLQDVARQRNWRAWSLHTKIMLAGTAILLPWSVAMFALLEWTNPLTLGALDGLTDRLFASWFQGVATRTAGFNTVDVAGMHDSTSLMLISLMLIGGGPASTAGGLKVTTMVVMVIATVAFFRRRSQLSAFGRGIELEQVLKVMALTAISLVLVFLGVFLLALSHDGHFLDISFEVASAFGTAGLSRGYTGELSGFGRAVIMAIMFLGKVGPLTLGFFLATQVPPRLRYPAGKIHLG
ncbi:TrkH family potassium uptake protein [Neomegalonema sp.]|uniref:TrkH family potassium uptake protein n=1 Tax=Neomegalonema sp. TaxID=2039713 RepID=UPI0026108FA8|nr:potassium transporter TrkG [Neomegalonema sp.]MDD2867786.1 potassium transporter TrkG [Neomegalonema sp.]